MDQKVNGKNKIVGIIIVVLIIIGGLIWWGGTRTSGVVGATEQKNTEVINTTKMNDNSNVSNIAEKAYTQTRIKENGVYVTTVNYTVDGFVPPIVYINAGEAVRFVNKNEDSMRIVSNEYQSLTLYSGFGQEKTVGKGGKYEFTFNQKGVWGYNNLNSNPKVYGIVYVR